LTRIWTRRSPLACLLWPASVLFGWLAFLRRLGYRAGWLRSERVAVPVIVVGNLVAGGSGKTPLVLWLAGFLAAKGRRPGIVSRGYGARIDEPREATADCGAEEVGDEPVLLARRSGCPVWTGRDRARAARALLAHHPEVDVIVLDDGLQHYRLARDVEIALVDARGFGNGFLLPAGPLREPPSRLRTVDAVVAHATGLVEGYAMRLEGDQLYCLADPSKRRSARDFAGRRVHAVAGIGDPGRFFAHLQRLGLDTCSHPFPDHHRFQAADLEFGDDTPIVMTEKDAVKCRRFATPRHWVLPVSAVLEPEFGDWLMTRLGGLRSGL
jgi:tetraacyldisaccharide 4'-kinase